MARIGNQALSSLCHRLSIAMSAGVDIRTVMLGEALRAPHRIRHYFQEISDAVADGTSFGEAVEQTGDCFPQLFREIVQLGDETGHLPEVLERLASHYEHQVRLRRLFLAAITWPMIQLAAAIVIVGGLIWILGVIGNQPYDILGLGLTGNRGLAIYIVMVSGAGIIVVALVRLLTSESALSGPLQRVFYYVPLVGATMQNLALSRLTWALGLALQGGMEVRRALRAGLRSTRSRIFTQQIDPVTTQIQRGSTIYEALSATRVIPGELLDMIDVGEQSGRLPESLLKMSDEYQDRARGNLRTLAIVGGFLVWALVAAVIVFVIVNIVSGYAGFLNDLTKPP